MISGIHSAAFCFPTWDCAGWVSGLDISIVKRTTYILFTRREKNKALWFRDAKQERLYLKLRAPADDGVEIDSENAGEFTVIDVSVIHNKSEARRPSITQFSLSSLLPQECQVSSRCDHENNEGLERYVQEFRCYTMSSTPMAYNEEPLAQRSQ